MLVKFIFLKEDDKKKMVKNRGKQGHGYGYRIVY